MLKQDLRTSLLDMISPIINFFLHSSAIAFEVFLPLAKEKVEFLGLKMVSKIEVDSNKHVLKV